MIRVLLYLFSASSRTIWMASWEMFPLLYASSQPTLLFQHLIYLNGWNFLFLQILGLQTHDRIPRYRGSTLCLPFFSSPKYPTYTLTP